MVSAASADAFQLPGLVADPVEAIQGRRVGVELQLVFDLVRLDRTIAQRAELTAAGAGPQMLLGLAWELTGGHALLRRAPKLVLVELHAVGHGVGAASSVPDAGMTTAAGESLRRPSQSLQVGFRLDSGWIQEQGLL